MGKDCVFCKIINKEIPTEIEKETDNLIVFQDIHPKAAIHLLIVSKEHIVDIRDVSDDLWVSIKEVSKAIAGERDIKSFRVVANAGDAALIKHFHVHFLARIDQNREI
ncbi:MAG: HIT domain-containing protein [bacterium]|nr:HIT domain-containing protein [bacterium]